MLTQWVVMVLNCNVLCHLQQCKCPDQDLWAPLYATGGLSQVHSAELQKFCLTGLVTIHSSQLPACHGPPNESIWIIPMSGQNPNLQPPLGKLPKGVPQVKDL